ncbi:MAG: ATP-grasp domain-containing protein [Candidatus Omnitrophica bacterium]|jgi:D-alanine-D-alanine ligase|nr:ATP-grasp domain-containing protein [Candidatus Omnitrophota bacterium]
MNIALTYNLKKQDGTKPADYFSEYDSADTINAIAQVLRTAGHVVQSVDADQPALVSFFLKNRVDMVFNIAEGSRSKFRESEIPALLECLDIPYTGSSAFSLALALNKAMTKKILMAENIPTPLFQVFETGDEPLDAQLHFPLIVKPNREGSAKGISRTSVVHTDEELRSKVLELVCIYRQEVLVEEFISGKELTVGILENGKTEILPVLEIDFSSAQKSGEYFYSWRMKEFQGDNSQGLTPTFHCPARLDKATELLVKETALRTHRAIGCYDISRTDIRLDRNNVPYVLEINPLPGLDPKESNFPRMAYAAGMKYDDLIESVLSSAFQRRRTDYG